MNGDRTTPSCHPNLPTLGWYELPVLGQSRSRRARSRQRLLVALTGFVVAAVLIALGLALR